MAFCCFCPFDNGVDGRIHGADDVGDTFPIVPGEAALVDGDCAFVVEGATGVEAANPATHRIVIGTVAAFISEGPHDDAGMIFVALNHAHSTIEKGMGILFVAANLMDVIV